MERIVDRKNYNLTEQERSAWMRLYKILKKIEVRLSKAKTEVEQYGT